MSGSDIRQAAADIPDAEIERLLDYFQTIKPRGTYMPMDAKTTCSLLCEVLRHRRLAAHPADDGEPVTEQWWNQEVSSTRHRILDGEFMLYINPNGIIELCAEGERFGDSTYTLPLPHIKTRGQLRRLLEVL